MASPAEVLGDAGYIELSFTADAEAELADVGDFAEEDRRFDSGDADEVVNDAFAVFSTSSDAVHVFGGDPGPGDADEVVNDAFAVFSTSSDAVHVFGGDPGPGDVTFGVQVGERNAEEADF